MRLTHAHTQAYFGGCPIVNVPGFTHPVQDVYLEEVLRLTGHQPEGAALLARPGMSNGRGLGGRGPGRGRGRFGRGSQSQPGQPGRTATAPAATLPPDVASEVEQAIMQAFLEVGFCQADMMRLFSMRS